jgi:acetylornithine deacetylase/succinyl-diaminopimelate desuccinylase-like protein
MTAWLTAGSGQLADDDCPVAHSTREHVSLTAVEEAVEMVRETIERMC